jgi:hypothetical protein
MRRCMKRDQTAAQGRRGGVPGLGPTSPPRRSLSVLPTLYERLRESRPPPERFCQSRRRPAASCALFTEALLFFFLLIYPPAAAQRGARAGGLWGGILAPQNSILRARAKNRLASRFPLNTSGAPRPVLRRAPLGRRNRVRRAVCSSLWSEPSDVRFRGAGRGVQRTSPHPFRGPGIPPRACARPCLAGAGPGDPSFGCVRFGSVRCAGASTAACPQTLSGSAASALVPLGSVRWGEARRLPPDPVRFGAGAFDFPRCGPVRFGSVRFGSVRFGTSDGSPERGPPRRQHLPHRPARRAVGGARCSAPGWPPLAYPPTAMQGGARAGGLWGGILAPQNSLKYGASQKSAREPVSPNTRGRGPAGFGSHWGSPAVPLGVPGLHGRVGGARWVPSRPAYPTPPDAPTLYLPTHLPYSRPPSPRPRSRPTSYPTPPDAPTL